ncbi:Mim2p [Kluyveromyces lactis]|uniref:KLLA0F19646p n=1 Tax=Kluyveromyces lactis (strain ATCC 8585 / CBS 2359 / DSM 70799 / NBRC 1267 / NRRL Y-1140 / WM37) TaxID=284590 RepID=Q6CJC7_KLULA|nr:uncharacterized protein KLLA0_F19646g [Kluyveromyces lactis]CAG98670.1 KLLA0F19646p [Kluyveromyces lactis]|eukprot:XP_455962.1 uncharacterized protein KLLA0_F19646g [Kluyveromyces lactis]
MSELLAEELVHEDGRSVDSRQDLGTPMASDLLSTSASNDINGDSSNQGSASEYDSEEEYDSDVIDEYERQLSDAQREWERSLEQLWQAVTWIILPLAGKLLGRRTAGIIWRKVMNHLYS